MNRVLLALAVLVVWPSFELSAAEHPNIVVILADDLGWGSVGCYGANPELVRTPHIDRLAKEGRRFTDANTTSSVCSPTRYAVMTGRYCWRTSLISEVLGTQSPLHIETDRMTVASMLKQQGYQCAAVGKWHLGYGTEERCDFTKELKPGPLEIGFDYHFGVPANHGDLSGVYVENHWVYGLNRASPSSPSPPYVTHGQAKGKPVRTLELNAPKRVDEEVMETLTDKVVNWIGQQSADKPFFVYFTPVAVHNPITPSKHTAGQSKGGPFCDFLHDLDRSVGRVLDELDQRGFAKNTLVLFSSDNGGVNKTNGETPQNIARDAGLKPVGPFRGGKHDVWEGGFRVPYLVRWPGRVPAGTVCHETVSLVDTLASIAAITESKLPAPHVGAEDSHDVSKAWLGAEHPQPIRPDVIVHSADGNFAIRKGQWKWIEGVAADDVKPAAKKARAEQFQRLLFDLQADLVESRDATAQNASVAAELESLLNRYRDGGYSRELPPIKVKQKLQPPALPALNGEKLLELALEALPTKPWTTSGAQWSARDGAVWTKAPATGSTLSGPVKLTDAVVEYQIRLGDADRQSLRIHTSEQHSFRIVLSRSSLDVSRNPAKGESADKATSLGKQRVRFNANEWQTVRLTFVGDELKAEVAGVIVKAKDACLGEQKTQLNFIAFDGEVGLRKLIIAKP